MKNLAEFAVIISLWVSATAQMQSLGAKDTFDSVSLSAQEKQEIVEQVQESAFDQADDWTSELRVRRVDLGSSTGLVVQGSKLLCGATGNCQLWVFRKSGNKWVSLFSAEEVPIVEGFHLGPGATGGVKDLTVVADSSAKRETTVHYKFDGKFYRAK